MSDEPAPQTTPARAVIWPWRAAAFILIMFAVAGVGSAFNSRYPGVGWLLLFQTLATGIGVFCACMAAMKEEQNG